MKTFRSMALAAAALIFTVLISGCGSSGPSSPAVTRSAESAVPVQSLTDWLPSATGVLGNLTDDLSGISESLTADPASSSSSVTKLADDAAAGLKLDAPAGHPALDRAWDAVMNDSLLVSGDLTSGDSDQAVTDLNATMTDLDALQAEIGHL